MVVLHIKFSTECWCIPYWRAGSRIVNLSVETAVRCWRSGIDRDERRLWLTVGGRIRRLWQKGVRRENGG